MKSITINDTLTFDLPDTYHEMTDEELKELNFVGVPEVCISHPESHVIMTMAHQNVSGLVSMMLSTKDIAKKTQSDLKKANAPYGYQLDRFKKDVFGGVKAEGFEYHYRAKDIDMCGITYVAKYKKSIYYFFIYVRDEFRDQGKTEWKQITDTFKWHQ